MISYKHNRNSIVSKCISKMSKRNNDKFAAQLKSGNKDKNPTFNTNNVKVKESNSGVTTD